MKSLLIVSLSIVFSLSALASEVIYPSKPLVIAQKQINSSVIDYVSQELGLGFESSQFQLRESKESLMGTHYYFQQTQDGQVIEDSELIISLNASGEVIKVFNSAVKVDAKKIEAAIPLVSSQMALKLAWNKLQVNGELINAPKIELSYTKTLNLVYKIALSTSSPFGHWNIVVDAHDGKIISMADAALPRMKREEAFQAPKVKSFKALVSLNDALKELSQKQRSELSFDGITVNGTAQVFDPNPVVTLGRTDLNDKAPASIFRPAYVIEDLKDISFSDGVYSLKGPKIVLKDFESPKMAPSTSKDGSWIFERGNVAFNDAMTYLHLDRSMRYIESLGFRGSKAVFKSALEVDANGVDGADNSHYIPSSRQLAFGHGCVDDNEDTDVILHELGHAIHHHINSNWRGGDTGAMGEGFGDYWAASYSVTTPNGMDTRPAWVFKWDGHNDCWAGRKLDVLGIKYNPSQSYGAHSPVPGGVSDELWSTPIFQAFLELYGKGVSRSDIDKIILEAHFGLGSGMKMPQMAQAIVNTAKTLFPNKNYDQVYLRHFKAQNIL